MQQSQIDTIKQKLKTFQKQLTKEIEIHRYIAGKFKSEGNREHILHSTIEGKLTGSITFFEELFQDELLERKGKL